jgi:hypothetical protein
MAQDGVARLCEAWWHAALPQKELLVAKTVPFVLMHALRRGCARAARRAAAPGAPAVVSPGGLLRIQTRRRAG